MHGSEIAKHINEWVEDQGLFPFTVYNDLIPYADKDGAALRHDPAPAAEKRYIDGSRFVKWNLTYYIRCKDAGKARDYAYRITGALDGIEIETDDTDLMVEALTLPQFIGKDDKDFTTYSAAITCSYLEE